MAHLPVAEAPRHLQNGVMIPAEFLLDVAREHANQLRALGTTTGATPPRPATGSHHATVRAAVGRVLVRWGTALANDRQAAACAG